MCLRSVNTTYRRHPPTLNCTTQLVKILRVGWSSYRTPLWFVMSTKDHYIFKIRYLIVIFLIILMIVWPWNILLVDQQAHKEMSNTLYWQPNIQNRKKAAVLNSLIFLTQTQLFSFSHMQKHYLHRHIPGCHLTPWPEQLFTEMLRGDLNPLRTGWC